MTIAERRGKNCQMKESSMRTVSSEKGERGKKKIFRPEKP